MLTDLILTLVVAGGPAGFTVTPSPASTAMTVNAAGGPDAMIVTASPAHDAFTVIPVA